MKSTHRRADEGIRGETRAASWTFDARGPASVTLCRTVAGKIMAEAWGLAQSGSLVADATLIVSELVTNVHRHVRPPLATLVLSWSGETLTIQVRDHSAALPVSPPRARRTDSEWDWSGWGLRLVEATAAAYGGDFDVHPDLDGGGKVVQVRLPTNPNER